MKLETWHAPPGDEIPGHPSVLELGGPQGESFEDQDPVGGEGVSHWR
jgi:hypothetical protein